MRLRDIIAVLAALIAGILLARHGVPYIYCIVPEACATLLFFLSAKSRDPLNMRKSRAFNYSGVCMLFLGVGIFAESVTLPPKLPVTKRNYLVAGKIEDITPTNYGDRLLIDVSRLDVTPGCGEDDRGLKVSVITGDISRFRRGDRVEGSLELSHIDVKGNIRNDNYNRYLRNKGILLKGYAEENQLKVAGHHGTLITWSRDLRDDIEAFIETTPLESGVKDFLISILLGDRDFMREDVRAAFADSGISHILALSGMHVGIIAYAILYIVAAFFWRGGHKWKYGVAIPLIWLFICITGFSPSTVRAGMMLTIYFLSILLERKYEPLKSLLWTVILILCISPSALFDIGFQLSVFCVASIILFAARFSLPKDRKHPVLTTVMGFLAVTLVASFSCWALTSYYFDRFSLLFLPANIIAVPLLPTYVIVAIAYLTLYALGLDASWLGYLLSKGYNGLIALSESISRMGGSVENFTIGGVTVVLWTVSLISLALYFNYRKRIRVWIPLSMLALTLATIPLFLQDKTLRGFIVQSSYPNLQIQHYHGVSDSPIDISAGSISAFKINGKTIVTIDRDLATAVTDSVLTDALGNADFVVLSRGFKENPEALTNLLNPDATLILHNSIRRKRERELLDAFDALSLPVHSIRADGPFHYFED